MSHQIPMRGRNRHKVRVGKSQTGFQGSGGTAAIGSNAPYLDYYTQYVVDIDDKVASRYLNQEWGHFWSVPHFEFNLKQNGVATVAGTASGLVLRAPRDLVIRDVAVYTAQPPQGGTISIDVKIVPSPTAAVASGTSIFISGSAPSILPGSDNVWVNGTASIPPSGTAYAATLGTSNVYNWPAGSFLRVEVTAIGGTAAPGSNIGVRIGAGLPWVDSLAQWEVGEGAYPLGAPPPTQPWYVR